MRRRPGLAPLAAALFLVVPAGEVEAHAFAQRYDLPLPVGHYLLGAGLAVALSFIGASGLIRRPLGRRELLLPLPEATRWLVTALQLLSVALFLLLLAAGLLGSQGDWDRNLLPLAVWVLWWVGLAFVCALVGDLWALVNPWAASGRWVAALARRRGRERPPPFRLPDSLGAWPAVLLFLLFAWAELVWQSNAVPARLACAILLYSAVTWVAMAAFGVETWLRRGEVFTLLFGLFARFAPLAARRGADGRLRLVLRPYGAGLAQAEPPSASLAAFILVLLATVSFDGFSETPAWSSLSGAGTALLYQLGLVQVLGYVAAGSLVKTLGLLAAPLLFAAAYLATALLMARLAAVPFGVVARGFVLSLVPIAIGYHLAHYFSYLTIQGQMILPLASDPFGAGWDLFGTRDWRPDIAAVDMRLIWQVALGGVVIGHAAAVLVAHAAALRLAGPGGGLARRGQLPLVALMIAYTVLSLWILSQPIVSH